MQHTWNKPRRPSFAIILTGFLKGAKELSGYLLLILLTTLFRKDFNGTEGNPSRKFIWMVVAFLAGIIIIIGQKFIEWFFTHYWVEGEKVILTKGVFVKQRIELPLHKIQTIQIQQKLVHRLTDSCSITMDTAGSASAEFVIDAISKNDALHLQQWIRSQQQQSIPGIQRDEIIMESKPILKLSTWDFVKLCISENHLKSLILIVTFILGKAYDFSEQAGIDTKGFITSQSKSLVLSIWSLSILLSMAFGIAIILSTIRVIIRYFDYSLLQTTSANEMSWGLFTHHRKTIPFSKIEFISWSANWFRRKLGMFILRLHGLAESETEQVLHINMPVTSRAMLVQISSTYIPVLPADNGTAALGIQKAYVFRRVLLIGVPVTLFLGSIAWYFVQWHACWLMFWLIYFTLAQFTYYKNYRIWITEDAIQISHGIWGREHVVIHLNKIIQVSLRTSPYQRSNGYANLDLHLPGKVLNIPYLAQSEAKCLADYITYKIEV